MDISYERMTRRHRLSCTLSPLEIAWQFNWHICQQNGFEILRIKTSVHNLAKCYSLIASIKWNGQLQLCPTPLPWLWVSQNFAGLYSMSLISFSFLQKRFISFSVLKHTKATGNRRIFQSLPRWLAFCFTPCRRFPSNLKPLPIILFLYTSEVSPYASGPCHPQEA